MQNLLENVELGCINAAITAASNTDDDSDAVDMQGYEGVMFVTPITDSVATGVATLTAKQSDASAGTYAALSGAVAAVTSAVNDDVNQKLLVVDVYKPLKRYLKANLTSGTANIAFGETIAIKYNGRAMPISQLAAEVAAATTVISPAEA